MVMMGSYIYIYMYIHTKSALVGQHDDPCCGNTLVSWPIFVQLHDVLGFPVRSICRVLFRGTWVVGFFSQIQIKGFSHKYKSPCGKPKRDCARNRICFFLSQFSPMGNQREIVPRNGSFTNLFMGKICGNLGNKFLVRSRQCFNDAIPEHQRKTIVFDGVEMPIGIWETLGEGNRLPFGWKPYG